ncbi:uncharacterized protein LOC143594500 [Bidens hawaiensis]|uniref:uncharacterized protein LOC143594500 n=1 Tax=Bidens hawaiensis TaxID=980011 RepID=UPI00404AFC80
MVAVNAILLLLMLFFMLLMLYFNAVLLLMLFLCIILAVNAAANAGLIQALEKVFPGAEHRFCVRHIIENMKKQWRGDVFKNMFLKVAGVTFIPYYLKAMEEKKEADATLYDWVNQIPAKAWSKARYSGRAKCDMQLNNMCESFNKQLVGARDKPVITCLEYIREYMTKRIINVRKMISKAAGPLTPNATKAFEEIKTEASQLTVLMVDADNYEVNNIRFQCVVNVKYKTCTCRKWDLTGILCKHAVATINDMAINNMNVGIPEQWVSEAYWLDTWKMMYDNQIIPIPSEDYWMTS